MLEKEKLNIVDEELVKSIYKAIEVFDVIKDTRIKIIGTLISDTEKKYLSLLLGIYFTNNEVSKIIRFLRYNYDIEVHTSMKKEDEYEQIYNQHFSSLVDGLIKVEDSYIENMMLQLLEIDFIKKMHQAKGLALAPLKLLLNKSLNNKEQPKTLQKV